MANLALVLLLSALLAAPRARTQAPSNVVHARFFFAVNKTLVNNIIPTVTQTIYPLRTCVVIPAGVTSTCSFSTTEARPPTTLAVQPTPPTPPATSRPTTSAGPAFSAHLNVKQPVLVVTPRPTPTLAPGVVADINKTVGFADQQVRAARHLRLLNVPTPVESVQITAVPEIEDISFRSLEPEIESSQQDFADVEIHGLPESCFQQRNFLSNPITVLSIQRTGTPVTTTLILTSNTVNRVSLTIGGCLPNPPLIYDRC